MLPVHVQYKRSKYRGLFVKSAIDGDCVIVPLQETKMYEERLSDPDSKLMSLMERSQFNIFSAVRVPPVLNIF